MHLFYPASRVELSIYLSGCFVESILVNEKLGLSVSIVLHVWTLPIWRQGSDKLMEKYGRIDPFDPDEDEWSSFIERLEMAVVVNGVESSDAETQWAVLLTVCGKKTYNLFRTLCSPARPAMKSYDDLCAIMKGHCNPKPSVIFQRFTFHNRQRETSESMSDYVTALRRIAVDCEFGTELDDNLRDQLVCGVNNATVQQEMLEDDKLTLEKVIKIARSSEATDKNVQQLQQACAASLGRSTSTGAVRFRSELAYEDTVHRIGPVKRDRPAQKSTGAKDTNKPRCSRWDSVQHLANPCPLKDVSCHNRGKRTHRSSV